MDGLATLRELRKTYPKLPVIMFSALTERGAAATLDALALGATDYFTKPANVGSVTAAIAKIREELIPKIKRSLAYRGSAPTPAPRAGDRPGAARAAPADRSGTTSGLGGTCVRRRASGQRRRRAHRSERPSIVAIGVSTGGPNALAALLPALPGDLPVPIVIVQHMPPMFTRLLAERLTAQSTCRSWKARRAWRCRPGTAWIAPGDFHMAVARERRVGAAASRTRTRRRTRAGRRSTCCSARWRSAFGPRVLGVVLTGMGQDGLRGCEAIREAGGQVLAQDEATTVVWGMPGFVARAGLADKVLPLDTIAAEIVRRAGAPLAPGATSGARVHS